ncbi:MAG: hypothetical protein P4L35_10175, partial [Ignavibacteriaceae bacterium]|nr:hypothetical protein [Ignavibacteriaceae bacterium]
MKFLYLSLIIISFFDLAFPQQKTDINNIRTLYQSFDYRGVIQSADSLLTEKNDLDKSDLTEILLMKAVSHYALTEEAQTRKCFIDMLKIDRHLELDSEKVSPKIVS